MTYVPQNKRNLVAAAAAAGGTIEAAPGHAPARHRRPRWGRVTRRTLALALLVTAVPVGVGATVVVLSNDPPAPEGPLPVLGAGPDGHVIDRSPLPHPPASLLEAFSRLSGAATASDSDHTAVAAFAKEATRFGADADAARVLATVDGKRLWLIPGNGFVCLGVQPLDAETLATGCNTQAVALRDGVNVVDGDTLYGLLPDGIDRIEVTDDDGFKHTEPVTDNAYILKNANATVRYPVGKEGDVEVFRVIGKPSATG
jgi:hypothetical protein